MVNKQILAINFGGIGDEILFLSALISLKKEYPDAHITLALEPRSKGVKDLTDVIDDLITVEKSRAGMLKLLMQARRGNFDIVISSGGNKLIAILLWLTGIKERYGYDTGALSRMLLTKAVPLNKNQYAAAMYHDLVTPLTQHKTFLPEINVEVGEKIPNSVLIHPGVSKISVEKSMVKTIPAASWAQIIDLLVKAGKKIILAGGPDDEEVIREIGFPKTQTKNLRDLAQLIAKAEKFVCSDSAPLHIAVALGVKTYPIFGPTDDKKLIPQSPDVIPLKAACDCPVHPCLWEHRQTTCKTLDCLKLNPQEAINVILSDSEESL